MLNYDTLFDIYVHLNRYIYIYKSCITGTNDHRYWQKYPNYLNKEKYLCIHVAWTHKLESYYITPWDHSVSIVTRLQAQQPTNWVWSLARASYFSLYCSIQNGSGTHLPFYPGEHWVLLYPKVKRPGCETNYSPPSSTKVRNVWSYNSTPPYIILAWCLTLTTSNPDTDLTPIPAIRVVSQ
jgi:hypothetical protein